MKEVIELTLEQRNTIMNIVSNIRWYEFNAGEYNQQAINEAGYQEKLSNYYERECNRSLKNSIKAQNDLVKLLKLGKEWKR